VKVMEMDDQSAAAAPGAARAPRPMRQGRPDGASGRIRLYHDVDGVLFGQYGPGHRWQVRPGLSDWLQWVVARFELVWLTSWQQADLEQLLLQTYNASIVPQARYLPWTGSKVAALVEDVDPETRWLWLDDEPWEAEALEALGLAARFQAVNPCGPHALEAVRAQLLARAQALTWRVE
jgi:hypothetical protein